MNKNMTITMLGQRLYLFSCGQPIARCNTGLNSVEINEHYYKPTAVINKHLAIFLHSNSKDIAKNIKNGVFKLVKGF